MTTMMMIMIDDDHDENKMIHIIAKTRVMIVDDDYDNQL